jgi:hypothetical protein
MKYQHLLLLSILIACSSPKQDTEVVENSDSVKSELLAQKVSVTENLPAKTEMPENSGSIDILFTGTYHGDEVSEGAAARNWLGLFSDEGENYVLKKIKITTERVLDGLLDDEEKGEKTGWDVQTENGESPVMLISGGDLKEGRVEGATAPANLYPGDSAEFDFKGAHYLMYATGSRQTDSLSGETQVTDYNLHVVRTYKGKSVESVLVNHAQFDEAMTSVLWSGDLDGDNFIDFLIDMSNHYNVNAPTLFLSKPAGENEVAVPVAEHVSVGC